jgi:hypothetical protein
MLELNLQVMIRRSTSWTVPGLADKRSLRRKMAGM